MVVVLLLFFILCFSFFNLFQSCINRDTLHEIKTQLVLLDQSVSKIMDISEDVIETLSPDEEDEYEEDSEDEENENEDDDGEDEDGEEDEDAAVDGNVDENDAGNNEDVVEEDEAGNDAGDEDENEENHAKKNNNGLSKKKLSKMMIQIMKRLHTCEFGENIQDNTAELNTSESQEAKAENLADSSGGVVKKRHKHKKHHKTTVDPVPVDVPVPEKDSNKTN